MTARAPAGSFAEEIAAARAGFNVNETADQDGSVGCLLLVMAPQAQRLIARNQQPGVDAAVRVVARRATFAHRLMLEDERTTLLRVALGAGIVLRHHLRPAALDHRALVRVVAVAATNLAFEDGVMRRQIELSFLVQVTLETCLGRFAGIDDGAGRAAGINVLAAGSVAGFAPDILGVVARRLQMKVGRAIEALIKILVALLAGFRANISGSGNLRRIDIRSTAEAGA